MVPACDYVFKELDRPRECCGLDGAGEPPRCPLHQGGQRKIEQLVTILLEQVRRPDHWLEGALLSGVHLEDKDLSGAQMPAATLEGALLARTVLARSNLRHSSLASAIAPDASFAGADLSGANLRNSDLTGADLRDANISGAFLTGAVFERAHLLGIQMSDVITASEARWGESGEFADSHWIDAARVARAMGACLRSIGDHGGSVDAYYGEMTALHLQAVCADASDQWLRFWPPRDMGLCIVWGIHRLFWGYGVRPLRVVLWMLVTILAFGLVVFPVVGTCAGDACTAAHPSAAHGVGEGMALSLVTFATLGYGTRVPYGVLGEVLGGVEALAGALMMSAFLVSLATRHVHRG